MTGGPEKHERLAERQDPGGEPAEQPIVSMLPSTPGRKVSTKKLVFTPIVIALALVGTYLWITNIPLDSIERNSLSGGAVRQALWQQIKLVVYSTFFVLVIAIPLGIALTRRPLRKAAPVATAIANLGQSIPSIGLLALLTFWLGIGPGTALVGMVAYAVLPVLSNTMVGLRAIDPSLVDAARGIGMSGWGVLRKVELPLAVPLILAGVRNALVLNVGTGTLAGFVSGGGLGTIITNGIVTQRTRVLIVGSVLAVALALLVDWLASLAELQMTPHGLEAG
ncbi:ABC transporter permease [Streptantibioticus ferralitis]